MDIGDNSIATKVVPLGIFGGKFDQLLVSLSIAVLKFWFSSGNTAFQGLKTLHMFVNASSLLQKRSKNKWLVLFCVKVCGRVIVSVCNSEWLLYFKVDIFLKKMPNLE